MTRVYSSTDFKKMPWKNGGGKTLELYRIDNPNDPSNFLFRLSQATVNTSGPFSIFKNIDRVLYLVSGEGFALKTGNKVIEMYHPYQNYTFEGEVDIECILKGMSTDFNIMIDRRWGQVSSEVIIQKENSVLEIYQKHPCFLYSFDKAPILIQIEANEKYTYKSDVERKIIKISIIQS